MPSPSTALRGITSGPDGNLWFADQSREAVGRITLQGQVTEFPSGKVGGHRLGPGRYRVTVLPAGGTPQTAQFRVVG